MAKVLESAIVVHPYVNWLPDFVLRSIYRSKLASQLQQLYGLTTEEQLECLLSYVRACKEMPISVNTDAARDNFYDISNDLFKLFLGKNLKFSSGLYKESSYSLEQAEEAMLELYCERAQVENGQSILDLGGGYGSLAIYIAQRFPLCKITSMANSRCQKKFIEEECSKRGLTNVKAIDCDVTEFETTETFDRLFAISFFEHLKNYDKLLKLISSFMKPDSLFFVEYWCHKHFAYEMETANGKLFSMSRASVLGENMLLHFQEDVTIVDQWRINGTHLGKTSDAWVKNIDKNSEAIRLLFAKAFGEENACKVQRGFRNNFMLGAEMFNFNNGQEWVNSHQLFKKK